jgi:hypothetical protein
MGNGHPPSQDFPPNEKKEMNTRGLNFPIGHSPTHFKLLYFTRNRLGCGSPLTGAWHLPVVF